MMNVVDTRVDSHPFLNSPALALAGDIKTKLNFDFGFISHLFKLCVVVSCTNCNTISG